MHGLRNATEVRTEPLPILAANATSTYPTPGNRIFPATTWSEKSSSADGVSTPEKTTVSFSTKIGTIVRTRTSLVNREED